MNHVKRSMLVCLLAIVLTTLLTAGVAQAAGLTCGAWIVVRSPSVKGFPTLRAVAAISPGDAWAVGQSYQNNGDILTLTEHWNGTSWSVIPSPNPGVYPSNGLYGVAAVSTSDVWAVGYYEGGDGGSYQTLTEHWDGTSWSVIPSPSPQPGGNNVLYGVTAISANDVWAVGYSPQGTLTEHWDGTSWSVIPSPNPGVFLSNILYGVTAVSTSDVWAVGKYTTSSGAIQTLTEHWNGTTWKVFASPSPGTGINQLSGMTAVSKNDVWAVGVFNLDKNSTIYQTLTEHWNGTTWSQVTSPNPNSNGTLSGVAAVSSSNVWAVGTFNTTSGSSHTLIEHWNGTTWSQVTSPNPNGNSYLYGVARVPATSQLWAVGSNNGAHTLTEFYC